MKKKNAALRRAIEVVGTQEKVGEIVKASQQWVSQLARAGKPVPAEWCLPLEIATKGEITRADLRPDLFAVDHKLRGVTV